MDNQKQKKSFKMPHTLVILFTIMVSVFILTQFIPAGTFERVEDINGNTVVVPGSFEFIESNAPNVFDFFVTLQRGYVNSADIIFMIIFAYSFVFFLTKNGTLDAAISLMVKKIGTKVSLLIPISMLIFGFLGSSLGIFEEVYGLFPIFVGLFVALGYDALVGGATIFVGLAVGFAASTLNPYSIVVAQEIAGLPIYSGTFFRVIVFLVAEIIAISYVMLYARKIKADPTKSIMYGVSLEGVAMKQLDDLDSIVLTKSHKLCLLLFVGVVGTLFYGTTQLGWYIDEIAGLFLIAMLLAGIFSGYTSREICENFIEGTKDMAFSTLTVGFTRGILLLMQDAYITDTIVYYLVTMLQSTSTYFAAYGMYGIQTIVKFFVSGSFSQATLTMPILAPTSELIGLNKQITVLAYQFGNGFADIFFPTAIAFPCAIMGVPMNKWYKFITKLFLMFIALSLILLTIAVAINYV